MVPRLNFALMVVLIIGLLAGVTALALSGTKPASKRIPTAEEIDSLMTRLASPDESVSTDARNRLLRLGEQSPVERLRAASASSDPVLSANARETLQMLLPQGAQDPEP